MYCNNCGARIERDGSSFCPYCGAPPDAAPPDDPSASDAAPAAPIGAADAPGPEPADAPGPEPADAPGTAPVPGPEPADAPAPGAVPAAAPDESPAPAAPRSGKAGRRGRRPVVLVVVALVAAIAAAGGAVWWKSEQDRQAAQAAWDAAHAERSVRLTIVAPGYTSAATRIPLEVTGTDLDGGAVTRTEYVGADDPSISLQQGSYEIRVTASPILEDGSLYSLPEGTVGVTVGDADEDTADGTIELAAVDDPASVTDEQIAAAKAAAEADPQDDGRAESLAQSAVARRDDAVAAKKAAEEEKEAAEEAARQAEAQATQDKRQQVAKDFAVAYETTAVSPSGSYTSTDSAVLMSDSEWFAKVEPLIGSTVGNEIEHGFMGPSDRKLRQRAHDPRIVKVDGDKYYVEYEVTTWSQSTGWSTENDFASVLMITLDDDNRVIAARYGQ
jgi:hypothetical protein